MDKLVYTQPDFNLSAFNCPHCRAFAKQKWGMMMQGHYIDRASTNGSTIDSMYVSKCDHCGKVSLWDNTSIVFPETLSLEPPNSDLLDEVKEDYLEAASILQKSPRGAAALLRLAIQKTCKELGEKGKNINDDIANMVKNGLSPSLQQALDILRVTGNDSVHPGQIDLRDDPSMAHSLFSLVNLIAEKMISEPKQIAAMFETLPDSNKNAISKRDQENV